MSETLNYLKGEIQRLRNELEQSKSESSGRRLKLKEMTAEVARLVAEKGESDRRMADLESKVGAPDERQRTIDDLRGQLRAIKHSTRFRGLATEAGVHPEAIDDAWDALKLAADADEPDEAAMRAALDAARGAKPYLFKPAGGDPAAVERKATTPPPFGGGRGKEAATTIRLTREQRGDPKWMYENDKRLKEFEAAGGIIVREE